MKVKQFVMAYRGDHEMIGTLLENGFKSLRDVLRINVEVRTDDQGQEEIEIQFNTPVEAKGKRGWLNLACWNSSLTKIQYHISDKYFGKKTKGSDTATKGYSTVFVTDFLEIEFTGVGLQGGCPAEKDNDGCFFKEKDDYYFVKAEEINGAKEYCDCSFQWKKIILKAMEIPTEEILGAYQVEFFRGYRPK